MYSQVNLFILTFFSNFKNASLYNCIDIELMHVSYPAWILIPKLNI
jgi:hypothetical protein